MVRHQWTPWLDSVGQTAEGEGVEGVRGLGHLIWPSVMGRCSIPWICWVLLVVSMGSNMRVGMFCVL